MLKIIKTRNNQGYQTHPFPKTQPIFPCKFQGRPEISGNCPTGCIACTEICPTSAIRRLNETISIDMGRCLFCKSCVDVCKNGSICFTANYRLSGRSREDLIVKRDIESISCALDEESRRLFGHSLKLRQVSAGGCNACEADTNVLNTLTFDLGRFGIQFVASPRHADGILVTGPVTENMRVALEKTYEATPSPKIVIAVGTCAISGGPYIDLPLTHNGIGGMFKVDLYIPGCPPNPWTILDGLLRFLGKIR